MRKFLLIAWISLLFSAMAALFWYTDWKYSLPTPVPDNYQPVVAGSHVSLGKKIRPAPGRILFLHFFNPSCPCSRFNMPYFKELVHKYGAQVDFEIVVLSNKKYTSQEIRDKFDLDVPVFADSSMASACGVYSTPQAVIIDGADRLYYRGNYNKTRYCTDSETNYAEKALKGLLIHKPIKLDDPYAVKAYGCRLPNCPK
jgi:redoxin